MAAAAYTSTVESIRQRRRSGDAHHGRGADLQRLWLKGWLGVQKMKEIKALVIDGAVACPVAPINLRIIP